MPELPEVEHLRRSLEPFLIGRRVVSAKLGRSDVAESFDVAASDRLRRVRTTAGRLLQGTTIASLIRHGKQLAILADSGRVLVVQLGMSGSMTVGNAQARPPEHTHAVWSLGQTRLLFTDPRRFGGLTTYPSVDLLRRHRWSLLGPDALGITGKELTTRLAGTSRAIKIALLDQGFLAGVGNIYADEALFEARIAPETMAPRIPADRAEALAAAIRLVLGRAINAGGSTLRNYVDASGTPGKAQAGHAVYGRAGLPCVRCQRPLRSAIIAQRTTVWCQSCQATSKRR